MPTFNDDSTSLMGAAFDLANNGSQPRAILELIAKRILHDVEQGERNPIAIANAALDWLGMQRVAGTLSADPDIRSLELELRLVKAFAAIPVLENRMALVEFAERLTGQTTAIGRL